MTPRGRILVVDDEANARAALSEILRDEGYATETAADGFKALGKLEEFAPDVVLTDLKMPGLDGIAFMEKAKSASPQTVFVVMTAHGTISSAVSAIKKGADNYLTKPLDFEALSAVVDRAMEKAKLLQETHALRDRLRERNAHGHIVTEDSPSGRMRAVLDLVAQVGPSKASVLITGESGTGKELIAEAICAASPRAGGPFVRLHCAALAESLLESELFGHEKGAFTGAVARREGRFKQADGGTLFLDEIGEVSLDFQAKMLRVLQDGEVLRVGGSRSRAVDVRVVAATNRALRDEVQAGRFRDDLYFRLNVIPVLLAPLRERREDVLPLAAFFLERHARESGRHRVISPEAEQAILEHGWPGNVRELENVIERAVILARGDAIAPEDLLLEQTLGERRAPAPEAGGTLQEHIDRAAAERITGALAAAGGQRVEAARALGVDRTTLYRTMKRLGLE